MFTKTGIKLTLWYLLIIMLVSISFSIAIFKVLDSELNRVERVQKIRMERRTSLEFPLKELRDPIIDPGIIEESKNRIKFILFLVNLGVLGLSSLAGYFLAGRTLKPIQDMVLEQNRFITDSSHELRTPLTALKSEIEVSLRDKKLKINDTKKILESNLEEVNKLQYLTDNLIKLSQYQKQNVLNIESIFLQEILNEALRKVSKISKAKKINLLNNVKDYSIKGDRQTLVELFVILLDNAIKYSPKESKVTLNSVKKDKYIFVSIKDEGEGISEEDIPHIFDRFYRADKSRTKSTIPGYGLGLSIAKEIIEKHKGHLKVESTLGKGSEFIVSFFSEN